MCTSPLDLPQEHPLSVSNDASIPLLTDVAQTWNSYLDLDHGGALPLDVSKDSNHRAKPNIEGYVLWDLATWVQIGALPLPSCMTLD